MKIAGWLVLASLLWAVVFTAAVFGVPTVYAWWKQCECWIRGPDSYACWELDLLTNPKTPDRPHKNN